MPREAGETGLSVNAWKDMQSELLWPLDDDVLAGGIPADHVMVLRSLEEAGRRTSVYERTRIYAGKARATDA